VDISIKLGLWTNFYRHWGAPSCKTRMRVLMTTPRSFCYMIVCMFPKCLLARTKQKQTITMWLPTHLSPSTVIHLVGQTSLSWEGPSHFMGSILVQGDTQTPYVWAGKWRDNMRQRGNQISQRNGYSTWFPYKLPWCNWLGATPFFHCQRPPVFSTAAVAPRFTLFGGWNIPTS
jgi:hypothetical protein